MMLSEEETTDISETQTHRLSPNTEQRSTGHLPSPSADWDVLRQGCEFHLLRYAQSPLYQAPLTAPEAILDIGCGSGRWPKACQAQFPDATVIGLDNKPLASGMLDPFPGFQFGLVDVRQPLPFADATFDYVHIRFMSMVLPLRSWFPLLHECLRVLKPQGWLELQELGVPHISHATPWILLAYLGRANGVELFPGVALSKWLHQVGGVNIASFELAMQRTPDPQASARMMIRDGIALFEMCREALIARGIITPLAFDMEFRRMQQNLFIPNRQDTIPLHTAICQRV